MIYSERGDARDNRPLNDVRGVKLSTNAGLIDSDVDLLLKKDVIAHERKETEICRLLYVRESVVLAFEGVPYFEEVFGECLRRDGFSIDADTLTDGDEVGRGEKTSLFGSVAGEAVGI